MPDPGFLYDRPLMSLAVRYPFALPLATAHVHPCAVSTPQRRSAVTPTPPAAQPLKNRARDLREAQLLSRFIKRTDGDSSNRSKLLTPLQCGRTDGDSSNRSNLHCAGPLRFLCVNLLPCSRALRRQPPLRRHHLRRPRYVRPSTDLQHTAGALPTFFCAWATPPLVLQNSLY